MPTAKEEVRDLLDKIPDDSTFEDIQYHIYVRSKIDRAIQQVDAGETLSHEEVEQRAQKWLTK